MSIGDVTAGRLAPKRPLKVLIAEDNLINQRVALGLLAQLGHTGIVVGDGEKALKCLSKLQFDAVLMDVMMPQMDGLEALAAIRIQERSTGQHVPVLMATAHDESGDAERFTRAGADGYIPKPIDVETLHAELERVTVARP